MLLIFTLSPVGGVLRFPMNGKDISKAWEGPRQPGEDFHLGVTPATLRTRYNLTAADIGSAANNSQAVAQVLQSHCAPFSMSVESSGEMVYCLEIAVPHYLLLHYLEPNELYLSVTWIAFNPAVFPLIIYMLVLSPLNAIVLGAVLSPSRLG